MPDWEVTATTVHCDAVDDEVTILVNGDATARCTVRDRRGSAGKRQGRPSACRDGACALIDEIIARFKE